MVTKEYSSQLTTVQSSKYIWNTSLFKRGEGIPKYKLSVGPDKGDLGQMI
jgi:hypothetical protein